MRINGWKKYMKDNPNIYRSLIIVFNEIVWQIILENGEQ